MKWGVVVFPGSNCEADAFFALRDVVKQDVTYLWHGERTDLSAYDSIVLPGGFSYGDYLRAGAIARFSPLMQEVIRYAENGGRVLGICNGFQVLCEAGLLPGALQRNRDLQFHCHDTCIRVENTDTPFTGSCRPGQVLRLPVAHGEGNYAIDPAGLRELEANGQVVFRYCAADGQILPEANPNGSVNNIAGVCNRSRNVVGLMPHPERAVESLLGGTDGLYLLTPAPDRVRPRGGER